MSASRASSPASIAVLLGLVGGVQELDLVLVRDRLQAREPGADLLAACRA